MQRKRSEADWAVKILSEKKEAMYYRDLLDAIMEQMGKKKETAAYTSVYTRLNLDNRLIYQGEGYWYYDINRIRKEV
ncbi:DNA-directed RNA polymerase subunit delta [Syntrophomonas palmitatica]|uniref:DNA-directed RNA polymerase subunit delta n=1 Tax=Syntrophomonas palmitatica TaxID=402877 RepID=UPI0006D0F53D|nr:DNA-directed RNA polymerase subunit delta [Syntrophomonas palmitatica]